MFARNIYLVEDDSDDAHLFTLVVNEINSRYSVTLFSTARALFNKLNSDEILPDIIFIDLYLPDLDGFQIINRIKRIERYSVVPLIILSGSDYTELIEKAYSTGVNRYIAKPLKFSEYKSTIHQALITDWKNSSLNPEIDNAAAE